jgi:hypothetical protein
MVVVTDPTNEISFVVGLGFLMPSRANLPSSAPRGRIFIRNGEIEQHSAAMWRAGIG